MKVKREETSYQVSSEFTILDASSYDWSTAISSKVERYIYMDLYAIGYTDESAFSLFNHKSVLIRIFSV